MLASVPLTHPNARRSTTIFRKNKPSFELRDPATLMGPVNEGPHADLEDESGFAAAIAGSAVFSFDLAADDLDDAARRQETVAILAQERIDALEEIRDWQLSQAENNRTVANNIRALVGRRTPLALEA